MADLTLDVDRLDGSVSIRFWPTWTGVHSGRIELGEGHDDIELTVSDRGDRMEVGLSESQRQDLKASKSVRLVIDYSGELPVPFLARAPGEGDDPFELREAEIGKIADPDLKHWMRFFLSIDRATKAKPSQFVGLQQTFRTRIHDRARGDFQKNAKQGDWDAGEPRTQISDPQALGEAATLVMGAIRGFFSPTRLRQERALRLRDRDTALESAFAAFAAGGLVHPIQIKGSADWRPGQPNSANAMMFAELAVSMKGRRGSQLWLELLPAFVLMQRIYLVRYRKTQELVRFDDYRFRDFDPRLLWTSSMPPTWITQVLAGAKAEASYLLQTHGSRWKTWRTMYHRHLRMAISDSDIHPNALPTAVFELEIRSGG